MPKDDGDSKVFINGQEETIASSITIFITESGHMVVGYSGNLDVSVRALILKAALEIEEQRLHNLSEIDYSTPIC